MANRLVRFRAEASTFLAVGLLLAMSLCSGCRDNGPATEPQQQAAGSNATETAVEPVTEPDTEPPGSSDKIPLRILYVGLPNTERQADFVTFLSGHFEQVDTADYNAFSEEQTKDCDVAIFDKDGLEWKSLDISVSSEYSRATVSLGVPGAFWVRSVSSRMGYM